MVIIYKINNNITPFLAYQSLKDKNYSFLLESPNANNKLERYSIIGFDPACVIKSHGYTTKVHSNNSSIVMHGDPIDILKDTLSKYAESAKPETATPALSGSEGSVAGFPPHPQTPRQTRFTGGAVGYVSYNAGRFVEELPDIARDDLGLPDLLFIIPKELIIFDHVSGQIIASSKKAEQVIERSLSGPKVPIDLISSTRLKFKPNMSKEHFENIVTKAKGYVRNGDIYQVNLSQRFEAEINSDPLHIYRALRSINPSPFASYLNFGDLKLISCSPERQVLLEDGIVETRPIAGTRPRGKDELQDMRLKGELLLNEKERAEHIMLVDLERNDIGRVCEYGSVKVDELMTVEKYSHVMHIVSNVVGKIRKDKDQFDLFKACFPGGTITGCPKIRSMEIIEELEPVKRGPYTGTIGYFGFNGNMDMSIAIRTIILRSEMRDERSETKYKAYIQAGAGIVFDSVPEFEYHETMHKAEAMLRAIELAEGICK